MAPYNLLCLILICRIERLWRDVRNKVIQFYMDLFKSFERTGMLIDNEWHIFTLQYMFMTRIQEDLNLFKNIWNNHALSTEQNKTPLQLMILRRDDTAPDECIDVDEYGVDEFDVDDEEDAVADHFRVPCDPLVCPLSPENLLVFKARVLPLSMATRIEDLSDWYYTALEYVLQLKDTQL
jgi:hypothetical protein